MSHYRGMRSRHRPVRFTRARQQTTRINFKPNHMKALEREALKADTAPTKHLGGSPCNSNN